MSKIRNRERVQELQSQLINEIKTFIPKSGELVFRDSFAVFIEMHYHDLYETEKLLIYSLLQDGTLSTDDEMKFTIRLEELDVYELAYILDMLENNLFHINNEDDE